MVGAALQAVESTVPGLLPVRPQLCRWIDRTFASILRSEGTTPPRWNGAGSPAGAAVGGQVA